MVKEEKTYIIGHKHPDSDSIASAIGYAFFKRAKGEKAEACRLGDINNETAYLLDRFGFEVPRLLTDARKTLAEIELDPPEFIYEDTIALNAIRGMNVHSSSIAVCDENKKLIGFVSKSDLANIGLSDTAAEIDLLKHTPVSAVVEAINGKLILDEKETHINGKVSIVALSKSGTNNYDAKDRIVIVGDDQKAQLDLIEKGAGILIVVWAEKISDEVILKAKEKHCPIIISGHGTMNTSRFLYFAPPVKLFMNKTPVCFYADMLVEEAQKKMQKSRYKSFPVIEKDGTFAGYLTRYHVLGYKNKKIIMVDHNEFRQSVRAIEKAEILEVVDHHRINDFATTLPVSFRNEIVGSTATIIATMYRENQIPLTREMAGLLLGAIISDTLLFQSPTTTNKDKETANILSAISGLDIEEFGGELFKASATSENQSVQEMLVQDIKYYEINDVKTLISQIVVTDTKEIMKKETEILNEMNELVVKKNVELLVVAITSVLEDGSIILSAGSKSESVKEVFGSNGIQKGILSRKGQILPKLSEIIEE